MICFDAKAACEILICSDRTLLIYRQNNQLLEGIHWGRSPSVNVLYNSDLLFYRSIVVAMLPCPNHQRFIEIILCSRPEN